MHTERKERENVELQAGLAVTGLHILPTRERQVG
jgi:hypothetical protein